MRYFHQSIILGFSVLASSVAYSLDFSLEGLYWQPSESVDWALTNSNISATVTPNQVVTYKTIDFNFAPGFRVGAGLQKNDWHMGVVYTRYKTDTRASTSGYVISTFMPSKFNTKFYKAAQVHFMLNFNTIDLDLSKQVNVDDTLIVIPSIAIRYGLINQDVNTQYLSPINEPPAAFNPNNVLEKVSNYFSGIGPKVGIGGQWFFYKRNDLQTGFVADFSASYLKGKWSIHDTLYQADSLAIGSVDLGRKRDFGALAAQGFVGFNIDYKNLDLKIGYEVSDWFNQYQVFDNGSGTHTNDLVLQGIRLLLKFTC